MRRVRYYGWSRYTPPGVHTSVVGLASPSRPDRGVADEVPWVLRPNLDDIDTGTVELDDVREDVDPSLSGCRPFLVVTRPV